MATSSVRTTRQVSGASALSGIGTTLELRLLQTADSGGEFAVPSKQLDRVVPAIAVPERDRGQARFRAYTTKRRDG
jgi:hypothetical protein